MSVTDEAQDGSILETGKRLSESSLWKFQRQFFDSKGVRAWSERTVPTHVTSNAFMAESYARVIMRFLQDCVSQRGDSPLALDPEEPVNIVELGAGSGYFAYLVLSKLLELQAHVAFEAPRLRYIATDFTAANVEFWKKHPCFAPLIEYGLFDVARFDAENDEAIELEISGTRLEAGGVANPMFVIANYLFDTIYHDVFRVQRGVLQEGLTTLRATQDAAGKENSDPANALDHMTIELDYHPVRAVENAPYDDALWCQILAEYEKQLGDTALLLPTGGLRCLRNFERLSGGRFAVLSADKGYTQLDQLTGLGDPGIVHHGSISMMVNFHALGRYMELSQGGFMMATSDRETSLEIALLSSVSPESVPEMRTQFYQAIERVGPLDTYQLTNSVGSGRRLVTSSNGSGDSHQDASLDELLALLRLSRWDPFTLMSMTTPLQNAVGRELSQTSLRRTKEALHEVWKLYFPLDVGDSGRDLPFELGFLMYLMRQWPEAYFYYEHSLRLHGDHQVTFYNMGLCQHRQGQTEAALGLFDKSLALDGTYGPARDWRLRMQAELERAPLLPPTAEHGAENGVEDAAEDAADSDGSAGSAAAERRAHQRKQPTSS